MFVVMVISACLVEAKAWGYLDVTLPNTGYIAINKIDQLRTLNGSARGFNTIELILSNCTGTNIQHFDTYISTTNSDALASYINQLPAETILIGVTADEPKWQLTVAAKNALLNIGVNVTQLDYRGKVAFVACIGHPSMTVMDLAGSGGNNVLTSAIVGRKYCQSFQIHGQ